MSFLLVLRAYELEVPGSTQDIILPFTVYSRKPVNDSPIHPDLGSKNLFLS